MLQNPGKTLGFHKNMVYKIPPGGSKPYPASGLIVVFAEFFLRLWFSEIVIDFFNVYRSQIMFFKPNCAFPL